MALMVLLIVSARVRTAATVSGSASPEGILGESMTSATVHVPIYGGEAGDVCPDLAGLVLAYADVTHHCPETR